MSSNEKKYKSGKTLQSQGTEMVTKAKPVLGSVGEIHDQLWSIVTEEAGEAFQELTPEHQRFVFALEGLRLSQEAALRFAGVKSRKDERQKSEWLMSPCGVAARKAVRSAIWLSGGLPAHQYRKKLLDIADHCGDPNAPTWNPNACVSALKACLELDGHIQGKSGSGKSNITIQVNTGIDRSDSITIEGEADEDE